MVTVTGMYQFSDSESTDSDSGIRFKTDSTRNKREKPNRQSRSLLDRGHKRSRHSERSRERTRSSRRSRSPKDRKKHQSRDRKSKKDKIKDASSDSLSLSDEEIRRKEYPLKRHSPEFRRSDSWSKTTHSGDYSRKCEDRSSSSSKISNTHNSSKSDNSSGTSSRDRKNSKSNRTERDKSSSKNKNVKECESNTLSIGPQLPPHLQKIKSDSKTKDENCSTGPKLLQSLQSLEETDSKTEELAYQSKTIDSKKSNDENDSNNLLLGPSLPPHLLKKSSETEEDQNCAVGPMLPPSLQTSQQNLNTESEISVIGPALPSHLRQQLAKESENNIVEDEEDDEETFGPLLPGMSSNSEAHRALEERALKMKLDGLNPQKQDVQNREEWMLELPEVHASNLGLGPRQFRAKSGPDMSDR